MLSDLTSVIGFNLSTLTPTTIPLANGAHAFSGGLTVDGSTIYVGASDNTVHVLNTSSGADTAQVAVGLKDSNSNAVAPNLVVVLPH
jgi:outer membrane protein assembly factor BamB